MHLHFKPSLPTRFRLRQQSLGERCYRFERLLCFRYLDIQEWTHTSSRCILDMLIDERFLVRPPPVSVWYLPPSW